MKKQDATENQKVVSEVLQQWLGFKRFVLKAFGQEPISPEDEQEFLEIKSNVNKVGRLLNERVKDIGFEGDKVGAILRQCISVSQLRSMPVPERRGLYKEWHSIFVNFNYVLGAVEMFAEGWIPRAVESKGGTTIADIKGQKAGAKQKKSKKKIIIAVVVLLVAGAAAYFIFGQG